MSICQLAFCLKALRDLTARPHARATRREAGRYWRHRTPNRADHTPPRRLLDPLAECVRVKPVCVLLRCNESALSLYVSFASRSQFAGGGELRWPLSYFSSSRTTEPREEWYLRHLPSPRTYIATRDCLLTLPSSLSSQKIPAVVLRGARMIDFSSHSTLRRLMPSVDA